MIPVERIAWALYCPFPKVRASAEFNFAEKRRNTNERAYKTRGYEYLTKKYASPVNVLTLYVGSDDYLTFKHADSPTEGQDTAGRISLGYGHIRRFIEGIQTALLVAGDGCFSENEDGTFSLTEKGASNESLTLIEDFFQNASAGFEPCIVQRPSDLGDGSDDSESERLTGEPGMRMLVNSWNMSSEISLDDFASFVAFYERFDLFSMSQSAMNIFVTQMNGIPGITQEKTAAIAPVRKVSNLAGAHPVLAGARKTLS